MRNNWNIHGQSELARDSAKDGVLCIGRALVVLLAILFGFQPALAATGEAEHSGLAAILKTALPELDGNQFWRALRAGPGSSFQFGPETDGWGSLRLKKDETKSAGPDVTTRHMVYENAQGLRVTRVFTFYLKFQAAEYKTYFENIGSQDLPALSKVFPLDLWFPFSTFERLVVHTTGTGQTDMVYPVPFWTLTHYYLLKDSGSGMPGHEWAMGTGRELADRGAHRPMALVEDQESGDGIFLELGWSGYWQIKFRWVDFKKTPFPLFQTWGGKITDTLQVFGGTPSSNFRLPPGERISSPTVLLGFYKGGARQGSNHLRRLKLEHFRLPWPAGVPEAPLIYDMFYSSRAKVPESELRHLVDRAAQLGMEYFFIGADWVPEYRIWGPYEQYGSPTESWSFPVDREIFPSGTLRPFSDYVHSKGMRFALWFDPERAFNHWPVVQEHPDWFMPKPSGPPSRTSYTSHAFNLGNPDALRWLENQMAQAIRDWNVDFIFHDRFGPAESYWSEFDPPGQSGITQMKYIAGRYELWRRLSAHFPGLLILNPGGPDFEAMRNTHLTMAGHHTGDGNYSRYELAALNWFFPAVYIQNDLIVYKDSYDEPYPLSAWLSHFAAMLGVGDPIGLWSPATMAQGKRVIEVYKSIRHLLKGDFYPLFPQAQSLETWDGWQFHDPLTREGFAVIFRLRYCEQPTATIHLQGVPAAASYRFKDPFGGQQFTVAGQELVNRGLAVSLPKNGAQLWHYTLLGESTGK